MKKKKLIILSFLLIGCSSNNFNKSFEKIIFHTTKCFGTCPVYHLEINNGGEVKLHIEKAYKNRIIDNSKIGYYTGKLGKSEYVELLNLIEEVDVEKSGIIEAKHDPKTVILKEGSQLHLIIYVGMQRKPMTHIYPVGHWNKLMKFVNNISNNSNLTKINKELYIEPFDSFKN